MQNLLCRMAHFMSYFILGFGVYGGCGDALEAAGIPIRLLVFVTLEHVIPERLDFLNVAPFAIYWNTCQQEAFGELTFQTDFLGVRA